MSSIATTVGIDTSDVWLSQKYRCLHNDLEDNFILAAAAKINGCYLVSEDEKFLKHAPVPALPSKEMLALLSSEQ